MTQDKPRRGDWIQTFTGKSFYPLDPRTEEVDPVDIAHSLGMICRFGGHVTHFYSVAQHCVLMSYQVHPVNALWALLHDAGEAYMGDMTRPLKKHMPTFCNAEIYLMNIICRRFGLDPICPEEVLEVDTRILCDERLALMTPSVEPWVPLDGIKPLGIQIEPWWPREAESRFLQRLKELTK